MKLKIFKAISPKKIYEKITIIPEKVIIYARVSTKSQEFDLQIKVVCDFLELLNIKYEIIREKVSAYRNGQVELDRLIRNTKVPIVVCFCDRFGRNVEICKERLDILHRKGLYVFSVKEMITSRDPSFIKNIKSGEYDSWLKSQRAKDAHRRNREARAINEDPKDMENYEPEDDLPPIPSVRSYRPRRSCRTATDQNIKEWCDSDSRVY